MGAKALPLNALHLVQAPQKPLLSLEEARLQCRVDTWGSPPQNPEDDLLMQYVKAATAELDGVDGWLGRALVTQTWRLRLSAFPAGRIRLPLPPLRSVAGIEYDAPDGTVVQLANTAYTVVTESDPGEIRPVDPWPAVASDGEVRITFVAGYGDPGDVPEIIRQYVRMRVGQFYDHRQMVQTGQPATEVPHVLHSLESIRFRGGSCP